MHTNKAITLNDDCEYLFNQISYRANVERQIHFFNNSGWDCHGLPVEFEIDKLLNIRGPEDVESMGIAAYNNECRKIVMRYSNEWEHVVKRMGRWIGKNYKEQMHQLLIWKYNTRSFNRF